MRSALLALAALLLLAGCVHLEGGAAADDARLECQREADAVSKARYTGPWNAAFEKCMHEREATNE